MADKKETRLTYLQKPLPQGQKKRRTVKVNWSGLNYRQTIDTGTLSYEKNISTDESPYLTPIPVKVKMKDYGTVHRYGAHYNENDENVIGFPADSEGKVVKGIYGYGGMLVVLLYGVESSLFTSHTSLTTYELYPAVQILDADFNILKYTKSFRGLIGDGVTGYGYREIGDKAHIYKLTDLKSAAFTRYGDASVADINPSDLLKRLLFFPGSYSLELFKVQDVIYRSGTKLFSGTYCVYPWSFIDDFTDESIIYNVIENPANPIPKYSELTKVRDVVRYADYNGTFTSDNDEANKRNVLGFWKYAGSRGWVSEDIEPSTGKKKNYIAEETKKVINCPTLKDVTVFQSRLFGIDDGKIYASGFNDYANWNLDTASNSSSANAWVSVLNANPQADGNLTAITTYQDRVIVFRENYMYEIRNTKNPFRVIDIFNEGCISSGAVAVAGGMLLFANKHGVRMYTGAAPKDIGYVLNIGRIDYASAGSDGIKFYLYCETDKKSHNLFIYDTSIGQWSEAEIDRRILCFANNNNGMYALTDDNKIYKLNSNSYDHDWAAETDFYTGGTIDIKHIQKIQLFADVDPGSTIRIHLLYDNEIFDEHTSHCVYEFTNNSPDTQKIPVRVIPRKTASYGYKIRISGYGYSKVYQMEVTMTEGGEMFIDG